MPHSLIASDASAPLHHLLLNFGKQLLQKEALPVAESYTPSAETLSIMELLAFHSAESLEKRVRELTVKHLGSMLRMQLPDAEEITMLNSLETLALAGEISYPDYIARVQNLFPAAMNRLEIGMRMKLAALTL